MARIRPTNPPEPNKITLAILQKAENQRKKKRFCRLISKSTQP
jgi:hypothetical protein